MSTAFLSSCTQFCKVMMLPHIGAQSPDFRIGLVTVSSLEYLIIDSITTAKFKVLYTKPAWCIYIIPLHHLLAKFYLLITCAITCLLEDLAKLFRWLSLFAILKCKLIGSLWLINSFWTLMIFFKYCNIKPLACHETLVLVLLDLLNNSLLREQCYIELWMLVHFLWRHWQLAVTILLDVEEKIRRLHFLFSLAISVFYGRCVQTIFLFILIIRIICKRINYLLIWRFCFTNTLFLTSISIFFGALNFTHSLVRLSSISNSIFTFFTKWSEWTNASI